MAANRNATIAYGTTILPRLTAREALSTLLTYEFVRTAPSIVHSHADGTTTQESAWQHSSGATATLMLRFA